MKCDTINFFYFGLWSSLFYLFDFSIYLCAEFKGELTVSLNLEIIPSILFIERDGLEYV